MRNVRATALVAMAYLALGCASEPVGTGATALSAGPGTIGLIADNFPRTVHSFDAESYSYLGDESVGLGDVVGDCVIRSSPSSTLGYVTGFNYAVQVVDLGVAPPALLTSIPISNPGEDIAVAPNGFLVVCDGGLSAPISVIDTAAGVEVSTFTSPDFHCTSVDVCADGSVLVTSSVGTVRRLVIDGSGTLSDTGEVLTVQGVPNNVYCAPGSSSGMVVYSEPGAIHSFAIPGLDMVETRTLAGGNRGISGAFSPDGTRFYVRGSGTPSFVEAFAVDAATGTFTSAGPELSIEVAEASSFYGIDQLAVHPSGDRLYVGSGAASPASVSIFDALSGAFIDEVRHPRIVSATGVCVARADLVPPPPPPPVNDECEGATSIGALPFDTAEDTAFATSTSDQLCAARGGTIWFTYTAPRDLVVRAFTSGSVFGPTPSIAVHTGPCGALTQLACDVGMVEWTARAGETYSIMVGGAGHEVSMRVEGVLAIDVRIDRRGTFTPSTGAATVTGVVDCSVPASAGVFLSLRQRAGRTFINGFSSASFACDGPTPFALTVVDPGGLFAGGTAEVVASACGCAASCTCGEITTTTTLTGSSRR